MSSKIASSGWVVLLATLIVQALVAMALMTLPVIAPVPAAALGISASYVGVYVAIVYVGAMTGGLLSGGAIKRYGAMRLSQVGLASCALGLALCAIPWLPALALGAAFIGLGYGPITPASTHLLMRTTPAHRMSFIFSIKQTGVPLGGIVAGMAIPGLQVQAGWQAAFLIAALVSIVCAAAVTPLCRVLDTDRDPRTRLSFGGGLAKPIGMILSSRALTILAAVSFLFSMMQLSLTTYLATYLHEDLALDLITAGFIVAVAQAAGVLGRLAWGYLADGFLGARRMLAALALLGGLCGLATLFMTTSTPLPLLLLVLSLFGSSVVGWNGVFLAEIARQAGPGQAGLATGGALAFTYLGVVLGPPVFGWIATVSGSYGVAYASLLVPALICFWLTVGNRSAFVDTAAGRRAV